MPFFQTGRSDKERKRRLGDKGEDLKIRCFLPSLSLSAQHCSRSDVVSSYFQDGCFQLEDTWSVGVDLCCRINPDT